MPSKPSTRSGTRYLKRRALRVQQSEKSSLYVFTLAAEEILKLADISRISRGKEGRLVGYQRPEVRNHIQGIVDYLDGDDVLFPNPIILALPSSIRFRASRGPGVSDGHASSGTLEIPLPRKGQAPPAWIVDGQQRAIAFSKSKRPDFPVCVNAFVADEVSTQREQFLRINNTKPLPRGLVTELLPEVSSHLPPKLAARKIPSRLCDLLNQHPDSPFQGLIKRASTPKEDRKRAVVTDTSIVNMLEASLSSASGCLFPYRNIATGETDFDGIWALLTVYWTAVSEVFPDEWGKPPRQSRLLHGVGVRAMGRLMDKVMATMNPKAKAARRNARRDLALIAPHCHWSSGRWEELGVRWNDLTNIPQHHRALANTLIRLYVTAKRKPH